MRVVPLALALLLAAFGVGAAYGFGEMIERSLPGSYHDSPPSLYAWVGAFYGAIGVVLMLSALYLTSLTIRDSGRIPVAGLAVPFLVLACFLPYERWIGSAGYALNVLLGAIALAAAVAFVRQVVRTRRGARRAIVPH
jgi:hypothetical protein